MKKEDFKQYLLNVGLRPHTAENKVSHCNVIEKRLNIDLDEIAADPSAVTAAWGALKQLRAEKILNCTHYLKAFENYIAFANQSVFSWQGDDAETEHFAYSKKASEQRRMPGLCKTLEAEYGAIVDLALTVLHEAPVALKRIDVILSPERRTKKYRNSDDHIIKAVKDAVARNGAVSDSEIRKAIGFSETKTGTFVRPSLRETEPHIVLYYDQIKGGVRDEYAAKAVNVLAREYMRYAIYECFGKGSKEAVEYSAAGEALADFFSVMYSLKRGKSSGNYDCEAAYERYKLWSERRGTVWNCANAIHFYTVNGENMPYSDVFNDYYRFGCIDKFVKVFAAMTEPRKAFELLTQT